MQKHERGHIPDGGPCDRGRIPNPGGEHVGASPENNKERT